MAAKISDYEKKMIEMRYQMQENKVVMEDCFKDLENWTQDIKVKEKKVLEDPNYLKTVNKGLPPIRSLETPKKKKKVKKEDLNKKTTAKKLNSYDYRAWDKLNVDKLCEEIDNKKESSSSDYTTDDEYEEEQKKVKANWEKERGNHFFKDNLFNDAINCYTRAIELDPTNHIYPANRAMCLIKQEKYGAAELDCSLSLTLDSNYAKAYHRRATCRTYLKKYDEAKKDIEALLNLEPNNKIAQLELVKLEEMMEGRRLVFPIHKKEEEKSKKQMKRVEIEEINDESVDKIEIKKNLENLSQRIQLNSKEQSLFELDKSNSNNNIINVVEDLKKRAGLISTEKEDLDLNKNSTQVIVSQNKTTTTTTSKQIPDVPTNGYQFRKDWQFLNNNLDNLALYFKKIDPNQYEKLFLNGLESDNLSKILIIFKKYFHNDPSLDLFPYMDCLSKTKRFQTQLMFLSESDKKIIDELIEILKISNKHDLNAIKSLSERYNF